MTAVVVDPTTRQPIVLLQGKRDRRPLALAIGQFEANGIAIALQGVTPPRPLTHDLFLNVLGDLRASLKRIVVTDLRDDVFYAQLHLEAAGTPAHDRLPALGRHRAGAPGARAHPGRGPGLRQGGAALAQGWGTPAPTL